MKLIALFIILAWPLVTGFTGIKDSLVKDRKNKISGIIASIIVMILTYVLYYFAGLFSLLNK